MFNLKFFIGVLILLIVLIFAYNLTINSNYIKNNLTLTISSEHNNYLKGESIWLNVNFTNLSDNPIYLKHSFSVGGGLHFEIKTNSGNELISLFKLTEVMDSIQFLPGDYIEKSANIDFYTMTNPNYLGDYTIKAFYDQYESNEIKISIVEPEKTELIIYNFIQKYDSSLDVDIYDRGDIDSLAENILNLYPKSRYSSIIADQLLRSPIVLKDSIRFNKIFKTYMQNNANRLSTNNIISDYSTYLKMYFSQSELIPRLEILNTQYPQNEKLKHELDNFINLNFHDNKHFIRKTDGDK